MSKAAKSVFVFGIYILIVGTTLMIMPNTLLGISGLEPASDVWVRVTGMLIAILGFYYTLCAKQEITYFFKLSVIGRIVPSIVFTIFVLLGFAKWPLILFSTIDVSCAIWTAVALRSSNN
jgi:hypothetical protein